MKGRVERDIWYIENWTFWLDLRIVWLTLKNAFLRNDQQAY
jgi:putative colanic acid biosynthesis UDP-glucose lipid carrier transferase